MMFMGKPLYVAMWQPREDRRQFLQRQHLSKRGNGPMAMAGRMMPPMAMGYGQMGPGAPMNMYPPAGPGGPRGAFQRPVYGQRMGGPGRGGYNMPAGPGYMYGAQMMQAPRGGPRGQPMQRGGPRNNRGPRSQMQSQGRPGQFQMTQQARNMPPPVPPQQQQQQQQQDMATMGALTPAALAAASPADQKNMIGERLYPLVHSEQPDLAGKVTGMLLDGMETAELLHLLEAPDALRSKIHEAMEVLAASAAEAEEQ